MSPRSNSRLWRLLAVVALLAPVMASAQAAWGWQESIWDGVFGSEVIMTNLKQHTEGLRMIFVGLALPILIGGTIARWRKSSASHEYMETWLIPCLLVGFIAVAMPMVDQAQKLGDGIANVSGFANKDVASRVWELQTRFSVNTSAAETETEEDEGFWAGLWHTVTAAAEAVWTGFQSVFKRMWLFIFMILCYVLCTVMGLVYMLAEGVRTFLLQAGGILLPVFIAALGTESFRGPGLRYILGMVGIAMWPVGWMMGNLATVTMVDAATEMISQLCTVTVTAAAIAPVPGIGVVGQAAPYLAVGTIVVIVMVLVALVTWSLVVVIFAPKIIGKTIKDGAMFFGPMLGVSTQAALGAGAVGTAVAAGVLATAATVASGGTAAPVAAGGAAAATGGATAAAGGAGSAAGGGAAAGGAAAGGGAAAAGGGAAAGGAGSGATSGWQAARAAMQQAAGSLGRFASSPGGRMLTKSLRGMSSVMELGSQLNLSDEGHSLHLGNISRDARAKALAAAQGPKGKKGKKGGES